MTSSKSDDLDDEKKACVDCGTVAPPTETNYTLISQRHGWRLTRTVDGKGRRAVEWRCPKCYARFREKQPYPFTGLRGSMWGLAVELDRKLQGGSRGSTFAGGEASESRS